MKSIELTGDHKSKLLEMCKKLFPEYELVDYDCQFNDLDFDLIGYRDLQTKSIESIHWFEFCTITLWNKLYLKLGTLELKNYYELLLNNLINPIDYLYKEFKKLK